MNDESCLARESFDNLQPAPQLEAIPPPTRVWTSQEWNLIRRGHRSQDMDDRWHAFVEDQRLYLHRSWTGRGVYEAQFTAGAGGWQISSAMVTGDRDSYGRGGDEYESALLEAVIEWTLLDVFGGAGEKRWTRVQDNEDG